MHIEMWEKKNTIHINNSVNPQIAMWLTVDLQRIRITTLYIRIQYITIYIVNVTEPGNRVLVTQIAPVGVGGWEQCV